MLVTFACSIPIALVPRASNVVVAHLPAVFSRAVGGCAAVVTADGANGLAVYLANTHLVMKGRTFSINL